MGIFCDEMLFHSTKVAFSPFRLCSSCAVGFSPRGLTSASSLSRPSGGQGKRGGGSRDAPGIVSRRASSPPAGSRSSERGGSASGLSSVVSERALASLAPSGAGEGGVARSQLTSLARSLLGCLSPFLAARSTWGIVGDFGGPLLRVILSWFPIFGSWSTVG